MTARSRMKFEFPDRLQRDLKGAAILVHAEREHAVPCIHVGQGDPPPTWHSPSVRAACSAAVGDQFIYASIISSIRFWAYSINSSAISSERCFPLCAST